MVSNKTEIIKKQSGFTIVELLIVIVVIGILAAITIVAYNGITARANGTKAQTNGSTAQKVAEAMNADNAAYPATAAAFATGSASIKMPAGVTVVPDTGTAPATTWVGTGTAGSSTDGLTRVTYACVSAVSGTGPCLTTGGGGRIGYWDFGASPAVVKFFYVGSATSTSPLFYPAT